MRALDCKHNNMIPKHSPDSAGAIRARLTYLRNRKVALDALIQALERYSAVAAAPLGDLWEREPASATRGSGVKGSIAADLKSLCRRLDLR